MPPRTITLAILVFWLAMTGWIVYSDIWPDLMPEKPPAFVIDLADEAQQPGQSHGRWIVSKNGEPIFRQETWVDYLKDEDLYEIHSELRPKMLPRGGYSPAANFRLEDMARVSRTGDLKAIAITGWLRLPGGNGLQAGQDEIEARLEGEVHDGILTARLKVPEYHIDQPYQPVEIHRHGSFLSPLHPFNRLPGLHPGQRWRTPVLDLLGDSIGALSFGGGGRVRYLRATVRDDPETISWRHQDVSCLVIEYAGDDQDARTWVSEKDHLVLRQQFMINGETWDIVRE